MTEYLPILIVGAIIGSFALVFILAYIALQKSKEKFDDSERHMPDSEIIRRLLAYGKPYWKNFVLVFFVMLLSIVYDLLSPLLIGHIQDIIKEPFVLTERGQGYRRVFDRELSERSLEISPILEVGRTDVITALLVEGDMISYLPDFVTRDLVRSGKLCYLDVTDMNTDIWKQLIYHKNKWMSKSLKICLDYIKAVEFSN